MTSSAKMYSVGGHVVFIAFLDENDVVTRIFANKKALPSVDVVKPREGQDMNDFLNTLLECVNSCELENVKDIKFP